MKEVYAVIGASMGGALTWQIAYLAPTLAKHIFPIACDYRASDWLLTQTLIQKQILAHSSHPLEDARIHAMSCYRTPQSLNVRFAGQRDSRGTGSGQYDVESWLLYHGDALARRFKLSAYYVMTHLTSTIGVCEEVEALTRIRSAIHLSPSIATFSSPMIVPKRPMKRCMRWVRTVSLAVHPLDPWA